MVQVPIGAREGCVPIQDKPPKNRLDNEWRELSAPNATSCIGYAAGAISTTFGEQNG